MTTFSSDECAYSIGVLVGAFFAGIVLAAVAGRLLWVRKQQQQQQDALDDDDADVRTLHSDPGTPRPQGWQYVADDDGPDSPANPPPPAQSAETLRAKHLSDLGLEAPPSNRNARGGSAVTVDGATTPPETTALQMGLSAPVVGGKWAGNSDTDGASGPAAIAFDLGKRAQLADAMQRDLDVLVAGIVPDTAAGAAATRAALRERLTVAIADGQTVVANAYALPDMGTAYEGTDGDAGEAQRFFRLGRRAERVKQDAYFALLAAERHGAVKPDQRAVVTDYVTTVAAADEGADAIDAELLGRGVRDVQLRERLAAMKLHLSDIHSALAAATAAASQPGHTGSSSVASEAFERGRQQAMDAHERLRHAAVHDGAGSSVAEHSTHIAAAWKRGRTAALASVDYADLEAIDPNSAAVSEAFRAGQHAQDTADDTVILPASQTTSSLDDEEMEEAPAATQATHAHGGVMGTFVRAREAARRAEDDLQFAPMVPRGATTAPSAAAPAAVIPLATPARRDSRAEERAALKEQIAVLQRELDAALKQQQQQQPPPSQALPAESPAIAVTTTDGAQAEAAAATERQAAADAAAAAKLQAELAETKAVVDGLKKQLTSRAHVVQQQADVTENADDVLKEAERMAKTHEKLLSEMSEKSKLRKAIEEQDRASQEAAIKRRLQEKRRARNRRASVVGSPVTDDANRAIESFVDRIVSSNAANRPASPSALLMNSTSFETGGATNADGTALLPGQNAEVLSSANQSLRAILAEPSQARKLVNDLYAAIGALQQANDELLSKHSLAIEQLEKEERVTKALLLGRDPEQPMPAELAAAVEALSIDLQPEQYTTTAATAGDGLGVPGADKDGGGAHNRQRRRSSVRFAVEPAVVAVPPRPRDDLGNKSSDDDDGGDTAPPPDDSMFKSGFSAFSDE